MHLGDEAEAVGSKGAGRTAVKGATSAKVWVIMPEYARTEVEIIREEAEMIQASLAAIQGVVLQIDYAMCVGTLHTSVVSVLKDTALKKAPAPGRR